VTYPPYPEYKSSGVGWLGDVPVGWEVKLLRYVSYMKAGQGITVDMFDEEGENPVYGGNGLRGYTSGFTHEGDYVLIGRQGALCGNINYAEGRFWASEHAVVVTPGANIHVHWLGEVLRSMNLNQYSIAAAQPGLAIDNIKSLYVAVPPPPEQHAIADFLDRQTGRIDTLITKRRVLIERLKEKRSSLISRTVTRGLPPDAARAAGLDPHLPLRHSGVEWLGDVPEHWEVKRLKITANTWTSNVDKVPSEDELPVRLCNYTDVYYNDHIHPGLELMETTATAEEIQRFRLHLGDVVITKDSEEWDDIAVPALVTETAPDLLCGYHLAIIRPNLRKLLGAFLFRALQSSAVNHQFQIAATGVTRYGLPKSAIGEALLPLPPVDEQRAIADFLDRQTAKIDRMVSLEEAVIDRLQEYRSALITAAVTGKIDVRERAEV